MKCLQSTVYSLRRERNKSLPAASSGVSRQMRDKFVSQLHPRGKPRGTLLRNRQFVPGFTLVEILIVIAIIGILIVALISALDPLGQIRKGNDADRRNDIKQYQLALENYANNASGLYPVQATTVAATSLCSGTGALVSYMSGCPDDKKTAGAYKYQSNGGGSAWVLWAKLDKAANTYWVVCGSGKSGEKVQADFSISGGTCPL